MNNNLSNAFAVLDLDVEDATVQTTIDATKDGETTVKIVGSKCLPSSSEVDIDSLPGQCDDVNPAIYLLKSRGVMNGLSNAFAVLDLDVEDATAQTTIDATKDGEAIVKRDKGKRKGNNSSEMIVAQHDKVDQKSLSTSSEYKLPLVWIDLEMTGLNIGTDRILEIACIITDGNLTQLVEGPDLVIHQTKECLDNMGEWCVNHHAASGLTEKVLHSTINEGEAEKQVIDFVKKHIGNYTPLLAGNSVYVDFQFIKKYMPDLASLFPHVVVDVSSVKALCIRWYPKDNRRAPSKENKHRAMDDIKESIKELKFFKENIFKSSKPRK